MTYDIEVRIQFVGTTPSTVAIEARIERPDGGVHNGVYCREVSGVNGDPGRAFISIITKSQS